MQHISIGILDARHGASPQQIEAIAEWIVAERVAMLAGHFGANYSMVEKIAKQSRAIASKALAQWMVRPQSSTAAVAESRRGGIAIDAFAHPTCFLFFGHARRIQWPDVDSTRLPASWACGDDLMGEMVGLHESPVWPYNDPGSAKVPNLGSIN